MSERLDSGGADVVDLAKVHALLDKLARDRFYGDLTLRMQEGRVTLVETRRTLKVQDLQMNA